MNASRASASVIIVSRHRAAALTRCLTGLAQQDHASFEMIVVADPAAADYYERALFNGILGDKSSNGGNVLTRKTLAKLPPFAGPRVIYCAGCLIGAERLAEEGITVRQTPYEIRVS